MISIQNLTVRYGKFTAVDRLSLEIPKGELFGLVGPNGAGKTTSLKVLCGLLVPAEGTVVVNGHDVVSDRASVQRSLGYMADFFGVYDYLTTYEYLAFFGGIYGVTGERLEENINGLLKLTNLEIKRNAGIRELSRGMKQRLYFARALVHDPDLLVLDEPASGMDPRGRAELAEALREIHRRGKTIVISSHILAELQELCTSVAILEKGRLVGVRSMSEPMEADENRHVSLLVCREDIEKALAIARADPDVRTAERVETKIVLAIRDSDESVSRLVRELVRQEIRVQLPRYDVMDLEELFLKMTKGELT